jgi:hypothetical protein
MRDRHAASKTHVFRCARALGVGLLGIAFVSGCAGPRMGPGGPFGGPGENRPAPPALFVSPFGEVFTAAPGGAWPVADWFRGADANQDGVVAFEEFAADGGRWFAQLDTDRDGRLGQSELWAYEASLRELGGGMGPGGPGGGRGPGTRPGGAALGLAPPQTGGGTNIRRQGGPRGPRGYGIVAEAGFFNLPQPVKAADVNVDQRITADEWTAATQRWFQALDTDRDGRLTLAGLPKTPLQQRAERR